MAVANVLEQSKQGKVALESKRWLRHESAFQTHIESDKQAMFHFSLLLLCLPVPTVPRNSQKYVKLPVSTWDPAQSKGHLVQPNPTFLEQTNLLEDLQCKNPPPNLPCEPNSQSTPAHLNRDTQLLGFGSRWCDVHCVTHKCCSYSISPALLKHLVSAFTSKAGHQTKQDRSLDCRG